MASGANDRRSVGGSPATINDSTSRRDFAVDLLQMAATADRQLNSLLRPVTARDALRHNKRLRLQPSNVAAGRLLRGGTSGVPQIEPGRSSRSGACPRYCGSKTRETDAARESPVRHRAFAR